MIIHHIHPEAQQFSIESIFTMKDGDLIYSENGDPAAFEFALFQHKMKKLHTKRKYEEFAKKVK